MDPNSGVMYDLQEVDEDRREKLTTGLGLMEVKRKECAENLRNSGEAVEPVRAHPLLKGRNRNNPCPCGSGLKVKKCCGA